MKIKSFFKFGLNSVLIILAIIFAIMLSLEMFIKFNRLILVTTTCQNIGFYQLLGNPFPLKNNELVTVLVPNTSPAYKQGLKNHYFTNNQIWVKNIAAVAGQTVILKRQGVWVDHHYLPNSYVNKYSVSGRTKLIHYPFGTYKLKKGEVWLYAPGNYAFDSSFYGPVSTNNIFEKVKPYLVIKRSMYWLKERKNHDLTNLK